MQGKLLLLISVLVTAPAFAADPTDAELNDQYSYIVGHQIAGRLSGKGVALDPTGFADGAKDALSGKPSRYSASETHEISSLWQSRQREKQQAAAASAEKTAQEYLAENAQRDGVTSTDSGVQYEIISSGKGAQPKATSTVVVHYRGSLTDGTEFDSSIARGEPATFVLNQVIKGWQEALQLMHEGDKWKVTIPPQLGYGEHGAPPKIGPNAVLVFDIELLEVR